jgi:hypothetical protein
MDEVLGDDQIRSRATSTSREIEGRWEEDSSSSQPIQPSRTVEVVGQADLIPSVVRKPTESNRLMQFVGPWLGLPVPELQDPFVFRAISTTGHIPVPRDPGNMMRRVLSCKKLQFHRDVVHWQSAIGKSEYAITQKDCILAASLAQIVNEVRTKSLVIIEPTHENVKLNSFTREWIEFVRKRSSLVLAVRNFQRSVKGLHLSLIALIESIRQKVDIGITMEIPEIVKVTVRNACLVIGGISAMILTMHGKSYEGLNWHGAMQHPLMASDHFR